ncbi:MAG: hypothetical protein CMN30_16640 [Sandaracinus sp.]|nr:hypothetical protein [Sandaracinus sp.]|tara:strand:+ start:308 stop:988 length:681 start_codon:yes stop_codon:yes gene_type:complete
MTQPTDNSVQFALAELEALESARQEAEAREARARLEATRAAERADAEARAARQREEAERRARDVARAREEARLNVDAQVEARTAASQRTIESMKAELERIQAERELIHQRMIAAPEPPPRTGRHWPVVAGLLGATSSVLGVLLFVQVTAPPPAPEIIVREVEVPVAASVATPEVEAPAAPEPAVEAPVAEVPRPAARPRPRPRPRPRDVLQHVEDCGDDPLCGLDG